MKFVGVQLTFIEVFRDEFTVNLNVMFVVIVFKGNENFAEFTYIFSSLLRTKILFF